MITISREFLNNLHDGLFDTAMPERFLFGVRGAVPKSEGGQVLKPVSQELDVYDDTIGFVDGDVCKCYRGSVDPGRHFTKNPMQPTGCAHMIEGQYRFVKGRHKSEPRAWRGINVCCWRDKDKDSLQSPSERKVYLVETSINLHYGGRGNTVGEYSAGCQVVKQPSWNTFRDETYTRFGQSATYWLLNVASLTKPAENKVGPSVLINGGLLPKSVPMWISKDNRLVTVARAFLGAISLDGAEPSFTYRGGSAPEITLANGGKVSGSLVENRFVCRVKDLVLKLDPTAELEWISESTRLAVTSSRLRITPQVPTVVGSLEGSDNSEPIPDN